MSSTTTEFRLEAESRTKTGTNSSHALRGEQKIPGVVYGHGAPPVAISIERKALEDLLHAGGRHHIIALTLDGKAETAMIRDVQTEHIGRRVKHVDLLRVGANETISTSVRLVTVGVPRGVKDDGGVLDVILHEVTISGPASGLPDHVEVDVTELGVHGHVTAGDLKLPAGIALDTPPHTLLASVEPSKTATEVAAADEAAEAVVAEATAASETEAAASAADAEAKAAEDAP